MSGRGGRGLAPGRIGKRRVCLPGRSRGPTAARSTTGCSASASPPGRSVTRREGVVRQLKAIGPAIEALGPAGDDWAWNAPSLDHGLQVWVTPQAAWGSPSIEIRERGRYGASGPPATALREVKRTVELMDAYLPSVALWTVSLPDEDYEDLRQLGTWAVFQRELFESVMRLIRGSGAPALGVAVVELGARRARRTGRPMPHVHAALAGWAVRDHTGQWLLRPEVMDELVMKACRKAGLPDRDRRAGSKVEKVRGSVSGYLAKYMSKGGDLSLVDTTDGWDALIPHQWWNRSTEAKALRDGHVWKLPRAFAAFVEQQRKRLEALGLGMARLVSLGRRITKTSDRSIDVLCFRFVGVEQFHQAMEWFIVWKSDPRAFEREVDRCTSLRTLACDGADIGPPDVEVPRTPGLSDVEWEWFRRAWQRLEDKDRRASGRAVEAVPALVAA